MRSPRHTVALLAVLALASLAGASFAASPPPAAYKLPAQALAGLPGGVALERLEHRFPGGLGPKGIQYFQSPSGLTGTFVHQGPAPKGSQLLFPAAGEWVFLPDRRFQQAGPSGSRLVLGNGKAQVFDGAGAQIGELQDPGLGALYGALLKLTM